MFSFPLQSFPELSDVAMALMQLRPMCLTYLSPRGRISLSVNCNVKYRVSVSQSPRHLAINKIVVTHNLPSKYLPLTISTCRSPFKTLVFPTSVNTICIRAISTNRHFSRESQNSQSSFSKTKVSSILEGETLAMGMWSLGLGAVGAAIAGLILANTDFLLTKPAPATVEYLGNADLKTIDSDERTLKAKILWERSGAVIMAVRRPG